MTGYFISLEGGEGAGKSTQIAAIAAALRSRGLTVVTTREPGGSDGGEVIRALLLDGDHDRWTDTTEALLFAAARADHVARLIRPALASGHWVLCDRFVDSTRAYQGGGGGVSDADIMALHRIGSAGLLPDRTLLLAIDPDEAARRLAKRDAGRPDRMGAKPADYHRRLAARFDDLAKSEPHRWRSIDGGQSADLVTAAMLAALADLLPC